MTREEAIKIIEVVFQSKETYKYYDSVTHQALNMAIEALETQELYLKALERMIEFHKTFTRILDGEAEKGEDMTLDGITGITGSSYTGINLISREKAMQAHPEYLNEYVNDEPRPYAKGWNDAVKDYWTALSSLPPAETVQVVRCKDCKWAEKAILDEYCVECTMYHTSCAKHGYCHHGERRENDDY